MRGNKLLKFFDYYIGIPLVFLFSLFLRGNRTAVLKSLQPKRILVVKLVALGDAVLLIPSLRALRKKYPQAEILFLGTSLTQNIVKQFPEYINEIIALNVMRLAKQPSYFIQIIKQLRNYHFDLVIDFEQWTRLTPLLIAFANIPIRIGFKTPKQYHHYLYTHLVERNSSRHEVDTLLSAVELCTGKKESNELELRVSQETIEKARSWLSGKGWNPAEAIVVLHPGCGTHGFPREWSPANYRTLIEKVSKERTCFFILSGMKSEEKTMDAIGTLNDVTIEKYFIKSTDEFLALLSLTNLVISGNTGAMHLAAALKIPQIALHGPTNSKIWGPINPNTVVINSSCPDCPCLDLGFEYHRVDGFCMEQIAVDEVVRGSMKILKEVV